MRVKFTVKGFPPLEKELKRLSRVRFDAVCIENMKDVYNRGKADGGTPVSTEATRPGGPHGELLGSLFHAGDVVGYTKDYALRNCDACKTGQKRRTLNLLQVPKILHSQKRFVSMPTPW